MNPKPRSPRILLVDDNAELRDSLKQVLEGAGYEVEEASDGELAMRAQQARPADVLLTDLFMPERDGIETIEIFRRRYPSMRIIAMSGDVQLPLHTEYLDVARVAGADATLRKPFRVEALLENLRRLSPAGRAGSR